MSGTTQDDDLTIGIIEDAKVGTAVQIRLNFGGKIVDGIAMPGSGWVSAAMSPAYARKIARRIVALADAIEAESNGSSDEDARTP